MIGKSPNGVYHVMRCGVNVRTGTHEHWTMCSSDIAYKDSMWELIPEFHLRFEEDLQPCQNCIKQLLRKASVPMRQVATLYGYTPKKAYARVDHELLEAHQKIEFYGQDKRRKRQCTEFRQVA